MMTNETKRAAAAREAREDEANQASQDAPELEGNESITEELMREEREPEKKSFEIGDEVTTMVNNVKVRGVVESIQLQKNLIDVKVYEPRHTHHCLIVARPPAEVHARSEKAPSA